jgi:putative Holliday junction resolvase
VALADSEVKIAIPFTTVEVDDDNSSEIEEINEIIVREEINVMVVGLPRNQSGEETAQSEYTKEFAKNFEFSVSKIEFQDESLTSIQAENLLKSYKKPYSKGDIDMTAASIILQDYLEENF